MSTWYPGESELPVVPSAWLPSELVAPTPKRWGSAPVRGRSWYPIVFWTAYVAAMIWCWKGVAFWFALWLVMPGCCCCWW